MSDEPRFAPNGNRLPDRLPIGHRLVDTTKTHWLIGPSIGCGGFGDIYLTKQFDEKTDSKLTYKDIVVQSNSWTHVIKFEHFSGPLFAEINFYLRVARKETLDNYMTSKKLKHLGMPRFIASGIYDPAKPDNPLPVCVSSNNNYNNNNNNITLLKPPAKKPRARKSAPVAKVNNNINNQVNGNRKIPLSQQQTKEKKYRFLVLQRFGDDVHKIWLRSNSRFSMTSAFSIAIKVIETLEYIHSHGYVHADIKASNLLIGRQSLSSSSLNESQQTNTKANVINGHSKNGIVTRESSIDSCNGSLELGRRTSSRRTVKRKLPPSLEQLSITNGDNHTDESDQNLKNSIDLNDEIYLIDFGLVEKFNNKDGEHREHVEDQRKANNGTMEFCSRDAHIGAFSRRSDLESLAFNLLYWVSGGRLPWCHLLKDHALVEVLKKYYIENLEEFVNYCFNEEAQPQDAVQLLKGINQSTIVTNGRQSAPAAKTKAKSNNNVKQKKRSTAADISNDANMCNTIYEFLKLISSLNFKEEPNYYNLKSILSAAIGKPAGRTSRKSTSKLTKTETSPQLANSKNPTPAMREILQKMKSSGNKK